MARIETVRVLLSIAAVFDLSITQFDVSTAFLNGEVEETLYMEPPEAVNRDPGKCLKLEKALYGLKQAPKAWNDELISVLKQVGLTQILSDQCVFVNAMETIYLLIYVDDGLIIGQNKDE